MSHLLLSRYFAGRTQIYGTAIRGRALANMTVNPM